ncbi:hypothetical protein AB0F91_44610 [Amycolatopsis sp. NPDC023774]|uniref:hypothetical protein n=1 Tax=Amycolatopsis sp. NPDC023774 TaxID=3155015 RepID=UPI0033C06CA1
MRFVLNGDQFDLDAPTVVERVRGLDPEPIQTHWVEVTGTRFPVKQALEVVLSVGRSSFTSQTARSLFHRLGFLTSADTPPVVVTEPDSAAHPTAEQAGAAFAKLVAFLRSRSLTDGMSELEHALLGADRAAAARVAEVAGFTELLLQAALIVRRDVGRISDVIHAAVISLALPAILEQGEVVANRPSLGPGNDKSRPFDLETDRRVAEFKVAVWSGGDMMRKRGVVTDLVHLALDDSGRRPELWVVGTEPLRFLRTSTSSVDGLLSRASRHQRARYEARYGSGDLPLRTFVAEHAAHVRLRNLADVLPTIAAALT